MPKIVGGGIEPHGLWANPKNVNPPKAWDIYPGLKAAEHAASEHAAVFVDINL